VFADDLSRHYHEHQATKHAIFALLESKSSEIRLSKDESLNGITESSPMHERPHSVPSISSREIDGERAIEVVQEDILSGISIAPEV
jgi:hypothetical protein